jgi:hypothetical protein
MSDAHVSDSHYVKMDVPPGACFVRFAAGRVARTRYDGDTTARGDRVIFDLDADGRIVGIELVGDGKPCQHDARG